MRQKTSNKVQSCTLELGLKRETYENTNFDASGSAQWKTFEILIDFIVKWYRTF